MPFATHGGCRCHFLPKYHVLTQPSNSLSLSALTHKSISTAAATSCSKKPPFTSCNLSLKFPTPGTLPRSGSSKLKTQNQPWSFSKSHFFNSHLRICIRSYPVQSLLQEVKED